MTGRKKAICEVFLGDGGRKPTGGGCGYSCSGLL